ncbi:MULTISPECIES: DMT family transporter [Gemmobacter]|jgi:drug/metabolite transporter (DMT)-like permease|uniref:RhaT family transporter n=1 Tax=Gemmobacter nanjingensis TaxID=488454 RepID=A0ABQ3FIG0_9RHOB|nr:MULTISPECIES: DMT family transporter [Gemmobacter]OJY36311.1 MAG: RhaT family transporter [Rhodobacterales bacterium 65-51]GHC25801.1 RhaT family transporter [Gemmobacter nanjingensis]
MAAAYRAHQNTRLGILLMSATSFVFALQDGISTHLAGQYNVWMVVMIRFWFFAAFALALSSRWPGGIGGQLRSRHPWLQALRGTLLVAEVCIMVVAFIKLGLIATHAVFVCYPLLVAALSGPILGESVGWRRWTAIGVGFIGVLIILEPGVAVFSPWALVPLLSAFMFALYGLLTRYVARGDSAGTSFLWTGIVAAVLITPLGLWFWQPMAPADWGWMGLLCLTGAGAHFMMIKAYEVAEASDIQPFALLQLVFIAILGLTVFDEELRRNVVVGAALVIAAALFTLLRARAVSKQAG